NTRYIEMYGFSSDFVHPGCTLLDVLQQRVALGTLSGNAVDYRATVMAALRAGKTTTSLVNSGNGRLISVINKPIPAGGWVGTHEEGTGRRRLEKDRDDLAARETRRGIIDAAISAFRERMDKLLMTVGHSADAMRATATTLSTSSGETSQHAEDAVQAS